MNEEILDKYFRQMLIDGKSEATINTAKNVMKTFFVRYGDKDIKQITPDDIKDYIHYLMTTKFKQNNKSKTKKKLEDSSVFQKKSVLRQFLKWLHKTYPEVPDLISHIELKKLQPKELPDRLTDTEIRAMIEKSHSPRDKALIAFLADSGCRRGELLNIKLKHVKFLDDGTAEVLLPKGKTKPRRIFVIWSAAYLDVWISNHPLKNDGEAYLFCSNREPYGKFSTTGLWGQVDAIAKRADIKKRVYIHLFRHTRATQLAQQGFSNQEMNVELGWVAGSTMFNVYVNLSGVNTDNKKRALAGLQIIEPIKAGIKTKECPRCHRVNPIDADRCKICRTAISEAEIAKEKAIEEAKKAEAEKAEAEKLEIMKKEFREQMMEEVRNAVQAEVKKSKYAKRYELMEYVTEQRKGKQN